MTRKEEDSHDVLPKRQRRSLGAVTKESSGFMISSQSSTASSIDSSIHDENIYVVLEKKVDSMDRQLQSLVSTIKDVMAREKKTYEELRALKQSQKHAKKKQKTVLGEKDLNQLQKNIQDFIRIKFYRHLKFVEDDTMPKIFARVIEQEQNRLPTGLLSEEEHDEVVTSCIRKAFTNLRHNSQTLIRRNYKRK